MNKATKYAYLAGIIDGEGTIGIHRTPEKRRSRRLRRENFEPTISCGMTNKEIVKMLHEEFTGAFYEKQIPNRKKMYYWKIGSAKSFLKCMDKIQKFLFVKLAKARVASMLAKRKVVQNGRDALTEEELSKRRDLYNQCKLL